MHCHPTLRTCWALLRPCWQKSFSINVKHTRKVLKVNKLKLKASSSMLPLGDHTRHLGCGRICTRNHPGGEARVPVCFLQLLLASYVCWGEYASYGSFLSTTSCLDDNRHLTQTYAVSTWSVFVSVHVGTATAGNHFHQEPSYFGEARFHYTDNRSTVIMSCRMYHAVSTKALWFVSWRS